MKGFKVVRLHLIPLSQALLAQSTSNLRPLCSGVEKQSVEQTAGVSGVHFPASAFHAERTKPYPQSASVYLFVTDRRILGRVRIERG